MNTNKENKRMPKSSDIDEFAQALLDKKTDLEVYKEIKKDLEQHKPSTSNRHAEASLSSALDQLRKDRGQQTISEEERFYEPVPDVSDEDFTTESLGYEFNNDQSFQHVHDMIHESSDEIVYQNVQLEEPEKEEKVIQTTQKIKVDKDPIHEKKKQTKKRKWIMILFVLCLGLLSLCAYTYKVYIYDPQNVASESQLKTEKALKEYADEYGSDMLLDAEKLELLDLNKDYKKLLEKQKTLINDYFKEQTGKSYKKVLSEVKDMKKDLEDESNPDYQQILSFISSWSGMSESDKLAIIDYRAIYDGLNANLQNKIDSKANEVAGKSFGALCSDMEQVRKQNEEQQHQANQAKIKEYQSILGQAQQEYNQYSNYADILAADLADAQANGYDTSSIQSQISTNQQMLNQAMNTINYYQSLIDSLQ